MLESVRHVQEAIELDLLIVGFRETAEFFREFCSFGCPVGETALWQSALSNIGGGMEDSNLVVNLGANAAACGEAGPRRG
jgi:hypothetical protein